MAKKGKAEVMRYLNRGICNLIKRYIEDYKIPYDGLLFTQSYSFYMSTMKKAAKKAGISKTISTHILKHTFVTQSSRHGVSAEIVEKQTGTDWGTLSIHYKADNPVKARLELQGIQPAEKPETFQQWLDNLVPVFERNFERIKKSGIVDGVRARL